MVKLLLNKHTKDRFLLILIINTIYAPVLEVNLLSSNILDVEYSLCINLDISSKPSQILKEDIIIKNLIYYNNLYLINLAYINIVVLLLQALATSKKLIFL